MGVYDHVLKLLTDTNPAAMARFVEHCWRVQVDGALPKGAIIKATQLNTEYPHQKDGKLIGDMVLLTEQADGPLRLDVIEFQSKLDSNMAGRTLDYCKRCKKKYPDYACLPMTASVIYIFDGPEKAPAPFLHWPAPNQGTLLNFFHQSIHLKTLDREELLAWPDPELRPLALLTEDPVRRIMVERLLADLEAQKLYDNASLARIIASWQMLDEDDQKWLRQGRYTMLDVNTGSLYEQWLKQEYQESEEKKAQKKFKKKYAQLEKKVLKERLQLEKKALEAFRQTVVDHVSQRFPQLEPLAAQQVHTLDQLEQLQQMLVRLSLAQDMDAVMEMLLALGENTAEDKAI